MKQKFLSKILWPACSTLTVTFVIWVISTGWSTSKLLSETSGRSYRNEQSIKEIMVELKELRKENNELLKFLVKLKSGKN